MEVDFDPLSLFTPSVQTFVEENETVIASDDTTTYQARSTAKDEPVDSPAEVTEESELEDLLFPIHFLDLPLLQLNPPDVVLLLFLRLLAPEEVTNFSNSTASEHNQSKDSPIVSPDEVFHAKMVTDLVPESMKWLKSYCPRFNTTEKLAYLPLLAPSLKKTHESSYNSWLTRIISSAPATESSISDEIVKQTSLRISENCGRTAQPEIIRKITIPGLSQYGKPHVSLREPSLTSDNLGLKTWGSSLILSSRLIRNNRKDDKNNTSGYLYEPILELGSGTGLVGIISSLIGYETTLTDLKEIVPNLQANIELNEITNAKVEELDWTNPGPFSEKNSQPTYNTVILSDPIYSSQHPYWVVDMVKLFLSKANDQARVLIQIPLRPKYENERALLWQLLEPDFEIVEDSVEDGYDDFGEMKFLFRRLKRRSVAAK